MRQVHCKPHAGDLKLDQLRVNQLRLCRQLSGSLEAGPSGVRLHARGLRPDEVRPAATSAIARSRVGMPGACQGVWRTIALCLV